LQKANHVLITPESTGEFLIINYGAGRKSPARVPVFQDPASPLHSRRAIHSLSKLRY
jgi:hypothetical protein